MLMVPLERANTRGRFLLQLEEMETKVPPVILLRLVIVSNFFMFLVVHVMFLERNAPVSGAAARCFLCFFSFVSLSFWS